MKLHLAYRYIFSLGILLLFACSLILPSAFAVNIGSGLSPDINTEDFEPLVWLCDGRVVRARFFSGLHRDHVHSHPGSGPYP